MPRFAIAPLGLTTEGSTKFKPKGWKRYLKKLQCGFPKKGVKNSWFEVPGHEETLAVLDNVKIVVKMCPFAEGKLRGWNWERMKCFCKGYTPAHYSPHRGTKRICLQKIDECYFSNLCWRIHRPKRLSLNLKMMFQFPKLEYFCGFLESNFRLFPIQRETIEDFIVWRGSCHSRQKAQAPTPQAPIRNSQTRKVANAKGHNHNTNLT